METVKGNKQLAYKTHRQLEPASFWMVLLLGSIGLHGFSLLMLYPFFNRLQPALPETVAIDFVELPGPTASPAPQPKAVSPPRATLPPSSPAEPPLSSVTPVIPSVALTPTKNNDQNQPRSAVSPPSVPSLPPQSIAPQPSQTVTPQPLPSVPTVPSAFDNAQQSASTAEAAGTAPTIGAGGTNPTPDSSLPTVAVTQQRTQSSGLKLTVLAVTQVEQGSSPLETLENTPPTDDRLTPAQPKASTQTFPDVVYPASIALNLGSPMQLRAEITPEGQAEPVEVLRGSAVSELDRLIENLIREVPFDPATQSGKPVSSRVDISLRLDPL